MVTRVFSFFLFSRFHTGSSQPLIGCPTPPACRRALSFFMKPFCRLLTHSELQVEQKRVGSRMQLLCLCATRRREEKTNCFFLHKYKTFSLSCTSHLGSRRSATHTHTDDKTTFASLLQKNKSKRKQVVRGDVKNSRQRIRHKST